VWLGSGPSHRALCRVPYGAFRSGATGFPMAMRRGGARRSARARDFQLGIDHGSQSCAGAPSRSSRAVVNLRVPGSSPGAGAYARSHSGQFGRGGRKRELMAVLIASRRWIRAPRAPVAMAQAGEVGAALVI
jgi:hypothetical protein